MSPIALNGADPSRQEEFSAWPLWDETDRHSLLSVLERGSWGGYPSPNHFAAKFAKEFADFQGAKYGVCCANGSVAIELALWAAGIEPGSEVIVPAYTFVATASSVAYCNSVPVFVDVDPKSYCLDIEKVRAAITDKTRAIIAVHLACQMTDMDALLALAKEFDLIVIEDSAHAHDARWRGKGAGSLGHMGTFSFQTSKLLTAGEGGIVLTNDEVTAMRLQSLVNCGRKEPEYSAYEGRVLGKNYRISEWSAGILSSQLKKLRIQTLKRIENAALLTEKLSSICGLVVNAPNESQTQQAIYQFIIKYHSREFQDLHRDDFLRALRAEGIPCEGDFYDPLYRGELFPLDPITNPVAQGTLADCYRTHVSKGFSCPVSERAAFEEAIWLPHQIFLGNSEDTLDIFKAFEKITNHISEIPRAVKP